jgi:Phage protein
MTHAHDRLQAEINRDPAYQFDVYGHLDLRGPWAGWRLRGRELVSPHGDRVSVTRLTGLLWAAKLTTAAQRRQKQVCRVTVIAPIDPTPPAAPAAVARPERVNRLAVG